MMRKEKLVMREVKIDLGMVITVNVPDSMSDWDVCGEIYEAVGGKGDVNKVTNMNADLTFYVGQSLKENLKNTKSRIQTNGSAKSCVKVEGDTRTPRQRAIEEGEK